MAERKSGPVKPPTLDLKANEAEKMQAEKAQQAQSASTGSETAEKPASGQGAPKQDAAKQESAKSETTSASGGKTASTATAGTGDTGAKPADKAPGPATASHNDGGTGAPPHNGPEPAGEADSPAWPFIATGVVGAIAGLGLAYGLAMGGYWPANSNNTETTIADIRQNMANLQGDVIARVTAIESRLNSLTEATETVDLAALGTEIENLQARVQQIETAPPETLDMAPVESQLDDLAARIESLEARPVADPGEGPGPAVSERLSALSDQQSATGTALSETQSQVTGLEGQLASLTARLSDLESELAAQPGDAAAAASAMRLPLALSGLETAMATGRSFSAELTALQSAVPGTEVPASLRAAAATGLARPGVIETNLRRAIPDILAAKPPLVDAGWTERTLDRLASLFAIRPNNDPGGTTPEALVARLEDAVARRDFIAADRILQALPQPMREAAGSLSSAIARHAEAASLAATARQIALTPAETSQ